MTYLDKLKERKAQQRLKPLSVGEVHKRFLRIKASHQQWLQQKKLRQEKSPQKPLL